MDTQTPGKFYFNNNTHTEIEKTFVYKEGKQYELIKIVSTDTYEKSGEPLAAETGYEVNGKWVLTAIHDGYQLQFGDASKVTWNVIRPVH